MNVYLLIHDDRYYDMGDTYVRGVFLAREAAEASLITRTASGAKSRAWGAHDKNCCGIEEREVADAPSLDLREDDPPLEGPGLIPNELMDELVKIATAPIPLWLRGAP